MLKNRFLSLSKPIPLTFSSISVNVDSVPPVSQIKILLRLPTFLTYPIHDLSACPFDSTFKIYPEFSNFSLPPLLPLISRHPHFLGYCKSLQIGYSASDVTLPPKPRLLKPPE